MDPIQIEKLYGRISTEIQRAGSERVQLFYIDQFLSEIDGDFGTYDSYIIQLFEWFPSLNHPLLFTGLSPDILKDIIQKCEEAANSIEELKSNKSLHQKIDLLHKGMQYIYNWLGEYTGQGDTSLFSYAEGGRKKEGKTPIDYSEVFIPVVETVSAHKAIGRLRKLQVELVGKSQSQVSELKPVFGVIGANAGNLGHKSAKAAENLLRESVSNADKWSATASFELSHTWHAGNSANFALSSLFYCEMLKAESKREFFKVNPGIAITGDIDESGRVLEV